ncbi:rhomboid family intramembrane serine protease [Flavitalea sp.]|nr:rhomboid family intramembrane serine protease [Flavitalea sp.]
MRDFRVRGFQGIPTVIKNLLIINALVFFAQVTFENSSTIRLNDWLALHDLHSQFFKFHQLFTYMFMHGSIGHIFFNMFALWMFGSELENVWGPKRFLLFYISCGVGAGLLHLGVLYFEFQAAIDQLPFLSLEKQQETISAIHYSTTIGASGSVFGCLAAFGYLFPNNVLYIYALFPIKVKWFVILYAAAELWMGISNSAGDNVAHWAHLGGALVGIIMVIYWNKTNRRQFY